MSQTQTNEVAEYDAACTITKSIYKLGSENKVEWSVVADLFTQLDNALDEAWKRGCRTGRKIVPTGA